MLKLEYKTKESGVILNIYMDLFRVFFKIGLFTFGGGYGMISVIEDICVEEKKWISHDEMMNLIVIAESTPGPIAVNSATFVGKKMGGIIGSVVATFGIVLPSFIVIHLISIFYDKFLDIKIIRNAFKGIEVAVGFLIVNSGLKMIKKREKKTFFDIIMILSFLLVFFSEFLGIKISSVKIIIAAGILSYLYYHFKEA